MGDVGEGTAVDEGGGMLQRLDQVGLQGVLQQGGHGALGLQVVGGDRLAVIGVGHDHPAQACLQVADVRGQAEHGHDLAGHGDVKAVLPGHALHLAAQAVHNVAQLPVIHIHGALPGNLLDVDAQLVALLDVVVQHRGQQVVGSADGMEVAGKVQIDVLHGDHLGIAAASSAALDAEHGAQRGLTQRHHGVLADLAQAVRQAHGGGGLALTGRGGSDGSDQDQLAVGLLRVIPQQLVVDLCLIVAVLLDILLVDAAALGHFRDLQRGRLLGDLDIGLDFHCFHSPFCFLFPGLLRQCLLVRFVLRGRGWRCMLSAARMWSYLLSLVIIGTPSLDVKRDLQNSRKSLFPAPESLSNRQTAPSPPAGSAGPALRRRRSARSVILPRFP